MNTNNTTIVVDAMGGDNAPFKVLKGIEIFNKSHSNINILLFGDKKIINNTLKSHSLKLNNIEIFNTTDNIKDNDTANTILRKKKNSSIFQGLTHVKNNKVSSGFVSAGNTGALMILSRLLLGMLEDIDRPAICSLLPNKKNFCIMLDLGANSTVVAKNLFQFALMGYSYHTLLKPNEKPKIGIINIGTEDHKGLEFLKEAHDLISQSFLRDYFIGFVEPNKITSGICDIIISDGYTGNIILKTAEGLSSFITNNLKNVFNKSLKNKLSYKIIENDLKIFKDQINPDKYNGASMIGVNGISIKSHGNASPYAFSCALDKCYNLIENNFNMKIRNNLSRL